MGDGGCLALAVSSAGVMGQAQVLFFRTADEQQRASLPRELRL